MKNSNSKLVSKICKIVQISFIVTAASFYALLFVGCPTNTDEVLENPSAIIINQ